VLCIWAGDIKRNPNDQRTVVITASSTERCFALIKQRTSGGVPMISPEQLLLVSLVLFVIGVFGVLVRRNLLFILISIEIMLNAVALLFVAAGSYHNNSDGQIMYLLILTLAASEVAVGLGLVIQMYRRTLSLDVDRLSNMRE